MEFEDFVEFLHDDANRFVEEKKEKNIDPDNKLGQIWVRDVGSATLSGSELLYEPDTRSVYIYNRLFSFSKTGSRDYPWKVCTKDPIALFKDMPDIRKVEQEMLYSFSKPASAYLIGLVPGKDYCIGAAEYFYSLIPIFVFFYRWTESIQEAINEFMRTIQLCKERADASCDGLGLASEMRNHVYDYYTEKMAEAAEAALEGGE